MDSDEARTLLDYYLANKPGELKFITSTPVKNYKRPDGVAETFQDSWDPVYFELQDVVSVEQHPVKSHIVMAFTAEGSACVGRPEDVLAKLTQYKHFDPRNPIATDVKTTAALAATYDALKETGGLGK